MVVNTRVSGLTITWTASVFTHGKMAESTKESIRMIRNMVLVFMFGLMVEFIVVIGTKENSMV